jgi:hypothetical protein
MSSPTPAVLLRYIDGLKQHDLEQIASTVADDAAMVLPARTLTKAEFLGMLRALYDAFPDWHYDHDPPQPVGPMGQFSIRWRQGGTHTRPLALPGRPPIATTGKTIRIPEQHFYYKVAGDQLIEIRPDPIPGGAPWGIVEQLEA